MAVSAAIRTRVPVAFLPLKPPQNSNHQNRKNRTKNAEKPPKQAVFLRKVVGVRGLEPRASCSQSRRATNCATPRYEIVGLPGRIFPNQARYQLRYTRIFACHDYSTKLVRFKVFSCLWSFMWSNLIFCPVPQLREIPQTPSLQGVPGFGCSHRG